jgi:hypothetical protein
VLYWNTTVELLPLALIVALKVPRLSVKLVTDPIVVVGAAKVVNETALEAGPEPTIFTALK